MGLEWVLKIIDWIEPAQDYGSITNFGGNADERLDKEKVR
jgi:hypothetical protein